MSDEGFGALLARAREVQERLASLQRELASREVEGSAGGGLVKAVATGDLRIRRLEIEPELLARDDRELLQDLVAGAVNAALENAQRMAQDELGRATGLPAGLVPGGGGPIG